MRIQSLSKVLVLPVLMLAGVVYFLTEYVNPDFSVWYILPALLGVVIYISHGHIDYWYLKKFPHGLDSRLLAWLQHDFELYHRLTRKEQIVFEHRLELYLNARLFSAKGKEDREVPEDIKALIACYGIYMGIQSPDILIGDFDRIFLYGHPFPTPQNHHLHSVEVDPEDGLIILNSALMLLGHLEPEKYFNIIVYAYTMVFEYLHGKFLQGLTLENLDSVMPWQYENICEQIGVPELAPEHIHVHHYIVFPKRYRQVFPRQAALLDKYFRFI